MNRSDASRPVSSGRRRLLGALAGLLPALLAACRGGGAPQGPAVLRLPRADLQDGTRTRVLLGDVPVELLRQGEHVTARSLLCTHQGCEVRYDPARRRYRCPCHKGLFDDRGRPVEGPPSHPLIPVAVRLEGEVLVVGPLIPADQTFTGQAR